VQDLKQELVTLSASEQAEVAAFLFQLRHSADADYQAKVERRLNDKDPAHWLTPEEFERRLDQK
jgi:hypothetical protein